MNQNFKEGKKVKKSKTNIWDLFIGIAFFIMAVILTGILIYLNDQIDEFDNEVSLDILQPVMNGLTTVGTILAILVLALTYIWRYRDTQENVEREKRINEQFSGIKSMIEIHSLSSFYTASRELDAFIDRVRIYGLQQKEQRDFTHDEDNNVSRFVPHFTQEITDAKKLLLDIQEVQIFKSFSQEDHMQEQYIARGKKSNVLYWGMGNSEQMAICDLYLKINLINNENL